MTKRQVLKIIKSHYNLFIYDKNNKNAKCICCNHTIKCEYKMVGWYAKCSKCKTKNKIITSRKKIQNIYGFASENNKGYYISSFYDGNTINLKEFELVSWVGSDNKVYSQGVKRTQSNFNYVPNDNVRLATPYVKKWTLLSFSEFYNLADYTWGDNKLYKEYASISKYINPNILRIFEYNKIKDKDPLKLEHLIKRTNKKYTEYYIDDDYNILEKFNKKELKFIAENNLNLEELKAFEVLRVENMGRIKNYLETDRYNDVFIKTKKKLSKKYKQLNIDNYIFKIPTEPREFDYEATKLHHCLSGYKDKHGSKCYILFMRHKQRKNKPLYTLEIKENKVVQFRGKENKTPNKKMVDVLSNFCKLNKLEMEL